MSLSRLKVKVTLEGQMVEVPNLEQLFIKPSISDIDLLFMVQ